MSDLDPEEVGRRLGEQSGETIGRLALGEEVPHADLNDAVGYSWISLQETADGVLNPHNHRLVDLFITP